MTKRKKRQNNTPCVVTEEMSIYIRTNRTSMFVDMLMESDVRTIFSVHNMVHNMVT